MTTFDGLWSQTRLRATWLTGGASPPPPMERTSYRGEERHANAVRVLDRELAGTPRAVLGRIGSQSSGSHLRVERIHVVDLDVEADAGRRHVLLVRRELDQLDDPRRGAEQRAPVVLATIPAAHHGEPERVAVERDRNLEVAWGPDRAELRHAAILARA